MTETDMTKQETPSPNRKPSYQSKAPPPLLLTQSNSTPTLPHAPMPFQHTPLQPVFSPQATADETRVQVDRKEVERLLSGDGAAAELFFKTIMAETGTRIVWPSRLKIGAKSKKDPYVRILGDEMARQRAKSQIIARLHLRQARVDLKIDVPFTEHSHIIGRQGRNTQAVMKATGAHVHFPDSNKAETGEKSNQVTISGGADSVEMARRAIRRLAPLTVTFSLDSQLLQRGVSAAHIMERQEHLSTELGFPSLTISIRLPKSSSRPPFCLVRGAVAEEDSVRACIAAFQQRYFVPFATVKYQMCMDILPPQQIDVKGVNNRLLHMVAALTSAQLRAPNEEDVARRGVTTFVISGELNAVFNARRYVIALLPATVHFLLPSEQHVEVQRLEQQFQVRLTLRPRAPTDTTIMVTATAPECRVHALYQLRQFLCTGTTEGAPNVDDYQFVTSNVLKEIRDAHLEIRAGAENEFQNGNKHATARSVQASSAMPLALLQARPLWQGTPTNVAELFAASAQQGAVFSPEITQLLMTKSPQMQTLSPPAPVQREASIDRVGRRSSHSTSPRRGSQPPGVNVDEMQRLRQAVEVAAASVPRTSETVTTNPMHCDMSQYNELRIKAIDKMAGDSEGLRMPDAGFAGYGFSLSMPHNVLRARTRAARVGNQQKTPQQHKEEDEPIDDGLKVPPCTPIQTKAPVLPSASNHSSNSTPRLSLGGHTSLRETIVPEDSEVHHSRRDAASESPPDLVVNSTSNATVPRRFAQSSAMETMRPLLAQARAVENPRRSAPSTQHTTSAMDIRESDFEFTQQNQPLELRHLLAVFRLEHLYQTFEENEIDLDALSCMDENDFLALKLTIGARAKLRGLQMYLKGEPRFGMLD